MKRIAVIILPICIAYAYYTHTPNRLTPYPTESVPVRPLPTVHPTPVQSTPTPVLSPDDRAHKALSKSSVTTPTVVPTVRIPTLYDRVAKAAQKDIPPLIGGSNSSVRSSPLYSRTIVVPQHTTPTVQKDSVRGSRGTKISVRVPTTTVTVQKKSTSSVTTTTKGSVTTRRASSHTVTTRRK